VPSPPTAPALSGGPADQIERSAVDTSAPATQLVDQTSSRATDIRDQTSAGATIEAIDQSPARHAAEQAATSATRTAANLAASGEHVVTAASPPDQRITRSVEHTLQQTVEAAEPALSAEPAVPPATAAPLAQLVTRQDAVDAITSSVPPTSTSLQGTVQEAAGATSPPPVTETLAQVDGAVGQRLLGTADQTTVSAATQAVGTVNEAASWNGQPLGPVVPAATLVGSAVDPLIASAPQGRIPLVGAPAKVPYVSQPAVTAGTQRVSTSTSATHPSAHASVPGEGSGAPAAPHVAARGDAPLSQAPASVATARVAGASHAAAIAAMHRMAQATAPGLSLVAPTQLSLAMRRVLEGPQPSRAMPAQSGRRATRGSRRAVPPGAHSPGPAGAATAGGGAGSAPGGALMLLVTELGLVALGLYKLLAAVPSPWSTSFVSLLERPG
jgi:hypothetical protein